MESKQTIQAVRQAQAILGNELCQMTSTLLNQINLANATCELLEQIHEHVQKAAEFPRDISDSFRSMSAEERDAVQTAHIVKREVTDLSARVWCHRKELRPLALAYGYYIVKHDNVIGIGKLLPEDWAWPDASCNED